VTPQPASPFSSTRFRVATILVLILSIVRGVLYKRDTAALLETGNWTTHTYKVITELQELSGQLRDAALAQRTYLIGHEGVHLAAYRSALPLIQERLQAVQSLTSDNSRQQTRLTTLRSLIREKLAEMANGIDLDRRRSGAGPAGPAGIVAGRTEENRLMDSIGAVIAQMREEENALLAERSKNQERARNQDKIFLSLSGVVNVGLIGFVGYLVRLSWLERNRSEQQMRALNAELEQSVAERTGQLSELSRRLQHLVTERTAQLEAANNVLLEERNLLRTLINNLPDFIFIKDVQTRFVLANSALLRLLGTEDMAGKTDFDLFPHHLAEVYHRDDQAILTSNQGLIDREEPILDREGNRLWLSTSKLPLRNGQGQVVGLVGICHDITRQKQSKEEIEQLKRELERKVLALESANRELEAFSYSVSHDLRAPLRTIDGFSEILIEECSDRLDGAALEYLRRVRAATLQMGHLITDLLNLARLSRVDLRHQTVDVSVLALGILDELRRLQPERKVECVVTPELKCSGDLRLLKVVLDNLLGNAWKFTSKAQQARIEVGRFGEKGEAGYFVKDNGAGFDMAYSGKLFTPFQRLHTAKEFDGTGIGLATVQRIVVRHGGRVWAEGKIGHGAVVFFTVGGGPAKPVTGFPE